MNRIGFGSRWLCLLGVGLAACATTTEAPENRASDGGTDPSLQLDIGATSDGEIEQAMGTGTDVDPEVDHGDRQSDNGGTAGGCDCGVAVPHGITVLTGGAISIEVPNIGSVTIAVDGGLCEAVPNGLHIVGDVAVDLGNGADVELLDADLLVTTGRDGGLPELSGIAILGHSQILSALDGAVGEGGLAVSVSLDTEPQLLLGSSAKVALKLAASLPVVPLLSHDLPMLNPGAAIVDADVALVTDGCQEILTIHGAAGTASELLSPVAHITLDGAVDVFATVADEGLAEVRLHGDVGLVGDSLLCGERPVASVDLPDAVVTLDRDGLSLDGRVLAAAALNPALGAEADADVRARITEEDFYIRVCASALTNIELLNITAHAGVVATACLALTPTGPTSCLCTGGGVGTDEDGGGVEGDGGF